MEAMTVGDFKSVLEVLRDDTEVRIVDQNNTSHPISEVKIVFQGTMGHRCELMVDTD